MEGWSLKQSGLLPILLINHENGESGCCEDWLFCGPCYFNRDLQWNVFQCRGCRAGQLLSHWTMAMLITEGLRGQQPKPTRADSLLPRHSNFYFSLLQTVGMFVPECSFMTQRDWTENRCKGSERSDHSNKDFKEKNPGNVIVFFTLHLRWSFSFPPAFLSGTQLRPVKCIWKQPLKKEKSNSD